MRSKTVGAGKRALAKAKRGSGFWLLFNGRIDAELKGKDAAALGTADGKAAVTAAAREGFPENVIIFLDQEEGGRLLPEQAAYLFAWVDAVRAGGARAGVYCSGIDVPDGGGTINTAQDIVEREKARSEAFERGAEHRLRLWIANDQCPPSPGCTLANAAIEYGDFSGDCRTLWWFGNMRSRHGGRQFTRACPANYGAGRQVLRAGACARREYVCGSEYGGFGLILQRDGERETLSGYPRRRRTR